MIKHFLKNYDESFWIASDLRIANNSLRIGTSLCFSVAFIDVISLDRKIEEWDERPMLPLQILF